MFSFRNVQHEQSRSEPKMYSYNKRTVSRGNNKTRGLLSDDDVHMRITDNATSSSSRSRRNTYNTNEGKKGRKPRYNPYHQKNQRLDRKLKRSDCCWYKVVVQYGAKRDTKFTIERLRFELEPFPFVPLGIEVEKNDLVFYIHDQKIAQDLLNIKLQAENGFRLYIKVFPYTPLVEMTEELLDKMKNCMASRYNVNTFHLGLSSFYMDEVFCKDNLIVPLNRPNVLLTAFELIIARAPNVRSLDLSRNNISNTTHFDLLNQLSSLKVLNISKNMIKALNDLQVIKGLPVEDISIDGNPLCDNFEQVDYIREIRLLFPNLLRLDGVELPPEIVVQAEESSCVDLPESSDSYLCNPQAHAIIKQFLQQYYALYDNYASRNELINAYYDNAKFSLTVFNLHSGPSNRVYLQRNRNMHDSRTVQYKPCITGKQSIVACFNDLPKTQHEPASFVVDLIEYTPIRMVLCVCGFFRESNEVRTFSRTFVLTPVGNGYNIINDLLTLSTGPTESLKRLIISSMKKSHEDNVGATTASSLGDMLLAPMIDSMQNLALQKRHQLIELLASKTGMNLPWSEKCLNETNWDIEVAFKAFTQFHANGAIPPEAFTK